MSHREFVFRNKYKIPQLTVLKHDLIYVTCFSDDRPDCASTDGPKKLSCNGFAHPTGN